VNDLFLDEIVQPDARVSGGSRSARRVDRAERDRKRRRRHRRNLTTFLILVLVIGGGGYVVVNWGLPLFEGIGGVGESSKDFPGPGTGSVDVVIPSGATGADMAVVLRDAGVVASTKAFTDAFAADPEAAGIQPGTYHLLLQMRAADAVSALLNPENKVQTSVTIPEGFRLSQILERLASTTNIPIDQFQAVLADPASVGLPAEAGGNFEGWLFPTTYTFQPEDNATTMITAMVAQTVATLDGLGVAPDQREVVLTKASLVERESPNPETSPMIARAIQNRLDIDMKLDIDAAVLYGAGSPTGELTAEVKAQDTPYNLYMHAGLPPTPIASPGTTSIQAVLAPAEGPWKFWVTINYDTGETRFAETYEEHLANVELLRQWEADNPEG
jgi:UPF0755 protein